MDDRINIDAKLFDQMAQERAELIEVLSALHNAAFDLPECKAECQRARMLLISLWHTEEQSCAT